MVRGLCGETLAKALKMVGQLPRHGWYIWRSLNGPKRDPGVRESPGHLSPLWLLSFWETDWTLTDSRWLNLEALSQSGNCCSQLPQPTSLAVCACLSYLSLYLSISLSLSLLLPLTISLCLFLSFSFLLPSSCSLSLSVPVGEVEQTWWGQSAMWQLKHSLLLINQLWFGPKMMTSPECNEYTATARQELHVLLVKPKETCKQHMYGMTTIVRGVGWSTYRSNTWHTKCSNVQICYANGVLWNEA